MAPGDDHDRELQRAFDGQAARFEAAPVQSDPAALARLVAFARLPPGARVIDGGCGPGLVAEAFLEAGHSVHGVDLSPEMLVRARQRCARFGARASFQQGSIFEVKTSTPFDAAVSRFVLHHLRDPAALLAAQAMLVRPLGAVIACDQSGDPDREVACRHDAIERGRDRTHMSVLSPQALLQAMAAAGLTQLELVEEPFELDFDEWFDRGTPSLPKAEVRSLILSGRCRTLDPHPRPDGCITLRCLRFLARGIRPG
ncbi:MAG TPA: class I SAM-dependent methyltransferase [Myxococcales bacterium]|nr:class I SAM-dependent methyltransferase [Myxococcales bacterium]